MIVVSNTSPLCYLTLIGHVKVLPELYGEVDIPAAVLDELRHPKAPASVSHFALKPPEWLKVHPNPSNISEELSRLDPGERAALQLVTQLSADVILLDEAAARTIAVSRGLMIAGTLGVLVDAADNGLIQLSAALDDLRRTNFRASPELWKATYRRG